MRRLILIALVTMISVIIHAQYICGVNDSDYANHSHDRHSLIAQYDGPYHVNVFFHIIKSPYDDQYSFPVSNLSLCMQRLNTDFAPYDITFDSLGMDYVVSHRYYSYSLKDSEYHDLMLCQSHYNAIDIYLLPINLVPRGLADGIPSDALTIGGTDADSVLYATSRVLSHEMGHCLGLYHTFHGAKSGGCNELVNGSNCDTCGDYVCDTPADPYEIYRYSTCLPGCSWVNTEVKDINNQLYVPDTRQIMSYTSVGCMEHFSVGQGERMIEHMLTEEILQDCTTPSIAYIQNLSLSYDEAVWAYDSIVVGRNVTSGTIGNVELLPDTWLGLTAGKRIVFKPGFKVHWGAGIYAETDSAFFQAPRNLHRRHHPKKDYLPLLENTSWTSFRLHIENPDYVSVYTNTGDTIIGDKSYRMIKRTSIDVYIAEMERSKVNSFDERTWYLYEDTENKRVYYYNSYSQQDEILYDFSLQIGDAHPVDPSFTLTDISQIENSGYVRKQLTFTASVSNKTYYIFWIEGIGNSVDMMDPSASSRSESDPNKIICVKKGEDTVYDAGDSYGVTCESIQNILDKDSATSTSTIQEELNDNTPTKVIRDGQILIERGDKTYTLTGQEVK